MKGLLVRWGATGVLAAATFAWVACDSSTGEAPDESAIAGTWVQNDSGTTSTLVLMDYPCRFAMVDAAGDTVRAFRGTHVVDSSVTPALIDFTVSSVFGRGTIPYTPMFGRIAVDGDSMRIAFPDSVGHPDRPPDLDDRVTVWYTIYDMVRTGN